ncbi:MAG: hypothetical protein N3F04_01325 [Candidatus Nezhaarchaeota archaeon]|nr:hypothetical protein [Candidatus Nezhaarchaeota archaeon]MCX8141419.1 hypothetical protein [Candidatus Nezhaarchaeota archaeon]MDW8049685.1 hypothetical protein [Nitrososphaerota archaeon]
MDAIKAKVLLKILESKKLSTKTITELEGGEELLHELKSRGIVDVKNGIIEVINAVDLAVEAAKSGVDVEAASRLLSWRDFERLCVEALINHSFKVKAPLRFKYHQKRHEIDVAALKHGVLLCLDCKHWNMKRGQGHKVRESAINHLDKCIKLAELASSQRILGIQLQEGNIIVPLILTLIDLGLKAPVNGVLVLPIIKLNAFLLELEAYIDEIPSIRIAKQSKTD